MGQNTAPETPDVSAGGVPLGAISYADTLDSGESLTGSVTIIEVTSADVPVVSGDLTISNAAVNTAVLTINNKSVAIGKAVQFRVVGQQAGESYILRSVVSTDSMPAQTLRKWVHLRGVIE